MTEVNASFDHGYASESVAVIRMANFQLFNPLNGSQGFSKGAALAAAKRRKAQRMRTMLEVQAILAKRLRIANAPIKKIDVWLTRVSLRKFDAWDGLPASLKAVVDGIADAFGKRDDDPIFNWHTPKQEKGKSKQHEIIILLEFNSGV